MRLMHFIPLSFMVCVSFSCLSFVHKMYYFLVLIIQKRLNKLMISPIFQINQLTTLH